MNDSSRTYDGNKQCDVAIIQRTETACNLNRENERPGRALRERPYFVVSRIIIRVDKMVQTIYASVGISSALSYASDLTIILERAR